MTETDLTAAVWAAVAEHEGAEPADWAAMSDLLTDQGDPLARPAAYLRRVAELAASGHRLATTLRLHLRARAEGGPIGLATLYGVMQAHRAPRDTAGRGWASLHRQVRYVGHHRIAPGQRWELQLLEKAVCEAGGKPANAEDEAYRLKIEALAIAEANGEA